MSKINKIMATCLSQTGIFTYYVTIFINSSILYSWSFLFNQKIKDNIIYEVYCLLLQTRNFNLNVKIKVTGVTGRQQNVLSQLSRFCQDFILSPPLLAEHTKKYKNFFIFEFKKQKFKCTWNFHIKCHMPFLLSNCAV